MCRERAIAGLNKTMTLTKKEDFTVLMPTYNREDLFELFDMAINSIYQNTILPYETIVIVDGPVTEEFKSKIVSYQNQYGFMVLWMQSNLGLTKALNYGLKFVTTKWIFRADGDDFNLPNRFEKQLPILKSGYDLVGGAIQEVDYFGNILKVRRVPESHEEILKFFPKRCPFNHMTVAYSTEFMRKIGGYPNIYLKEDYALWALFIKNNARAANLSDVLVRATAGNQMYLRRGGFKYIKSELSLQIYLVKCGVTKIHKAIFFGFIRSLVFLSPNWFRASVYSKILRDEN